MNINQRRKSLQGGGLVLCLAVWCVASLASATGTINTDFIQQRWPKEYVRDLEVGRYPVHWRHRVSRKEGLFAGVRFTAPGDRQTVWKLSSDYSDVGTKTPGVKAVRFLEQTPERQVIQVDVKVLWKTLTLTFEVEQEAPRLMRFRLVNRAIGEYRGVCTFEEVAVPSQPPVTVVELSTWLQPSRPVPLHLLLTVERMALLQGTKKFLESMERSKRQTPVASSGALELR